MNDPLRVLAWVITLGLLALVLLLNSWEALLALPVVLFVYDRLAGDE